MESNNRLPRVYVTNSTGQDFSKASEFGDIVYLTEGKLDMFRPHTVQKDIERKLEKFEFDLDYVLPAGNSLSSVFAFAYLAREGGEDDEPLNVKLLLFDAKKRDYICRTVEI